MPAIYLNPKQHATKLLTAYQQGRVFAYPTEAVFGLGCDPDNEQAVDTILALKIREREKGVILVARDFEQVTKYVDMAKLGEQRFAQIAASWPGHITWLLPKSAAAPEWITGNSDCIAIRISGHPVVRELCTIVDGPLVSTSANPAGLEPATSHAQLDAYFADQVVGVDGELGTNNKPSEIKHGLTGHSIRD